MTDEEVRAMWGSLNGDRSMLARVKDEGFYKPFANNRDEFNDILNYAPTEGQQTYSNGTDEAGNPILGNTINDFMAQPQQPKAEDNSFFAGTSWGGDFNAAEASERILADEEGGETNLPELIDGGRVDLGKEISDLHAKMRDTSLYAQYMYSAEDWAEKGKEIYDETGMDVNSLGDKNVFEKAWNLTREIKRQKALATDASGHVNMDKVYEAMPYLRDIHEAHGTAAAVMVMNSAKELQTINDVYDSEAARFAASIGYGIYRGGLSVVNQYTGAKAMARGLWSNQGLTQEEMNDILWVSNEMKKLPQNSYSSFGSILGGVLGSAAENAPIMLPEMIRTAAVNLGRLTGPVGVAASAGVYALMSAQIGGAQYIENITKTDENGNPIYTPRQAALLSAFQGFAEAALEKRSIAAAGKAVFSAGTAKKLSELVAKDAALASGQTMSGVTKEAAREILRERIQHGFKAGILSGAAELEEEFEQQISDMVLENIAQIAFRGDKADVSSVDEILSEAFGAAVEALPAVAGFGFMGAGGSVVADTEKVLSMRERFANAKASEIARGIYENQHQQNIVYNVAENLDNVQELQGKAPEIVTEILDAQNKKAGAEDTDVNIGMLMQQDGGADIVNQIAAENGTSQEDVQACINGTGFLTVKTSALQQAIHKMTPDQQKAVFPNVAAVGHQTNEQILSYARDMKAALDAVKDKTDKEKAEIIERFSNDNFADDEAARTAMQEITTADTNNPKEELKRRLRANQKAIDEYLSDTKKELNAGMGNGTEVVETMNEQGDVATTRVSNNAEWYRNWTADHPGEKMTEAEKERIAYENLTGTATRYATADYNNLPQEALEEMAKVKAELDRLFAERETLQKVGAVLNTFAEGEFLPTAELPTETREAYNAIVAVLRGSENKAISKNAIANAILAARKASRLAQYWREAGRDVKAKDLLPQIFANATRAEGDNSALRQEMARQIDEVRAKYEGTDKWMKAPNGKPTKLTEEQWLTVRTDAFKAWFGDWEKSKKNGSKVLDENGEPKVVHHGTGRADRVGSVFLPGRATSGPMAFFTDSFDIATNYSKNKQDTSLSRDEDDYLEYKNQFTVQIEGRRNPMKLGDAWWYLPKEQRDKIAELAPSIGLDEDEEIAIVPGNKSGLGGYDHHLQQFHGNHMKALIEEWLQSGMLFNEEEKFLQVLKLAGLDNVQYHDPYKREEAVYSVFLNIRKPFDATKITKTMLKKLEAAARKAQKTFNPAESYNADSWDKTSMPPETWIEHVHDDIQNGTTYAWTVIPDFVTETLQKAGYDGVQDLGGKQGGEGHTVYIPFTSTQVKSATGNNGQFLADDPNIYHQAAGENVDTEAIKAAVQATPDADIPRRGAAESNRFDNLDEQNLFEKAVQEVERLMSEDLVDPLGNKVYFAPGATETVREYALHLAAGQNKPLSDIRAKRVLGIALAKETIENPLAIVVGPAGRKEYLALYTDGKDFTNNIIVGVEEGQNGRVVTSMLTADKKNDKRAAVREFKKRISSSKEVLYIWEGLSGHPRPSSEQRASTLDAKLHPSGNLNVPRAGEKVNINPEQALDRFNQAAWHGSPYTFTQFDLGAIGTGEGAQAHGWGLYFAQDRKVSERYREELIKGPVSINGKVLDRPNIFDDSLSFAEKHALGCYLMSGRNIDEAIKRAETLVEEKPSPETKEALEILKSGGIKQIKETAGSLFQVEIPDDDVMLDEQKTFEEQPEKVRESLTKIFEDDSNRMSFMRKFGDDVLSKYKRMTGKEIYDEIWKGIENQARANGNNVEHSPRAASELLNQYGIKGITYEGGTDGRCYVVFDDKAISIIDTYNQNVNGGGARGEFMTTKQNPHGIVSLFENADQSTFMHEMSHFYMNELAEIASVAPDSQAAKDYKTAMDWAEWHEGDAEAFKGTATASEFAKREKYIKEAQKNGVAVMEDGTTKTLDQLLKEWRQEKFARGFETYLREGNAPTSTLKQIFRRFKTWLTKIYKDVIGVGVTPSAEVAAVMQRMIASDEEIAAMETIRRAEDISRVNPDLMDADTASMRERWTEEARAEAEEKLLAELLKEQEEKKVEEHLAAFEEEERSRLSEIPAFLAEAFIEEGMPEEEAAQLAGFPSVEAYKKDLEGWGGSYENAVKKAVEAERERYIREMPTDEHLMELAEDAMISTEGQARIAALEAEILKRRERKYARAPRRLAKAMENMDAALTEGTEEPLEKALRSLKYSFRWQAEQQKQIEEMQATIDAMKERIARGDERLAASEETISGMEAKTKELSAEAEEEREQLRKTLEAQLQRFKDATMQNAEWLRGVRDAANGLAKAYRELAQEQLSGMAIKDATNYKLWYNKAHTEARNCLKALSNAIRKNNGKEKADTGEQNFEEARQAKLRETLYVAEAREAQKNKRELDKILNEFKRRQRTLAKDKRGEIDASTKYYINHLLYMMGISKKDAIIPQTLESVDAHFASLKDAWHGEEGNNNIGDLDIDFEIPEWMRALLSPDSKKIVPEDYREYTMDELRDVQRLVNILYKTGRNKNRHLTSGKSLFDVIPEMKKDYNETVTVLKGEKGISKYFAQLLQPIVMLRTLGKTFVKYIYDPLFDGVEARTKMQQEAAQTLNALFDKYYDKKTRKAMRDKEIGIQLADGTELTKEKVLTLALNWGNEGNRIRVLNGLTKEGRYYTTDGMIEDIFRKTMTAKDWAFVQEAWDFINSFGDKVNEVVEKTTGTPMKRVEPLAFAIKAADGEIIECRGGYYPIAYDPDKSSAQADADLMTCAKAMGGASVFGTGLGSTKARTETGRTEAPLLLSMDVLFKHVNQQIHIATMRLACRDAYKVLMNPTVQGMIEESLGIEAYRRLKRYVEATWQEPRMYAPEIVKDMERLRRNTVAAIMGFRMSTAALNLANPVYMAREMGTVRAISAILEFYKHPKQYRQWCLEQSPFLANRANNIDKDLNVTAEQSFAPKNALMDAIQRTANRAIEETDMLCSLPAYYATYQDTLNAELKKGATQEEAEKAAHRAAEDMVRRIFGSSDTIDQSEIQRSKDAMVKAFTPFYTFAATQANSVFSAYLKARYQGSTRTVKEDGSLEIVKKNIFERYGAMVNATVWTYIVGAFAEQIIRELISKASGDDDDDLEAFLREWAAASVTGVASGFPGMNVLGELIGRKITGSGYPTRSFGVASAAVDRMVDAFNALYSFSQGKRDWIDTGRVIGRGIDAYYGFPDTITDAAFNFARKVDIDASFEEWLRKSFFDKKLKKKGR